MGNFPLSEAFIPAYFLNYSELSLTDPQIIHFLAIDFVQNMNIILFIPINVKDQWLTASEFHLNFCLWDVIG